jgi:excisionase family DNA binding protein
LTTTATERLLRIEDVIEMTGMKRDWIYEQVREDRIPHVRLGRKVRFRRESIEAWIAAQERGLIPASRNRPGRARISRGRAQGE